MENTHRELLTNVQAGLRVHAAPYRDCAWPRTPHTKRPALSWRHAVHIVVPIRRDVGSVRTRECYRAIEQAIYAGCEKFGLRLAHFSVMDDRVVLIGEADNKSSLSRGMQGLNVRIAKAINRVLGRRGSVLADRYYAMIVRTFSALRALINRVLPGFRWNFAEIELDEPDPFSSVAAGPLVVTRSWVLRAEPD